MPELPEVETVVRTLEKQLNHAEITGVTVYWEKIVAQGNLADFTSRLIQKQFTGFSRRGKYLLFTLEDEELIVHLRMEGKFYIEPQGSLIEPHTHLVFYLADGRELRYNDVRKFGRMYLYHKDEPYAILDHTGMEPWDKRLTPDYLYGVLQSKKKLPLKSFLLDQSVIAGIGNIYANEICYAVRLLPQTPCNLLTLEDAETIIIETRRILNEAIAQGGTTIRSYTSSLGVTGLFQQSLCVHAQKECAVCHSTIIKEQLGGRGTYYCPHCQKERR